ncbi:MAG: amidohydrolase [Rhodococcus sp. (in: high G+C Gram-positive bacteria)]|uniref:amidohydrolase family protein n=1 Tax=Rhodococcus sp. TaxID=1831 RepID=UPI0012125B68|nr:amidohydrolase family protein [Rhodococcus sp. (in: high G+C Gram-positive bacteria)]RZL22108.1 MAG: amidohydrolase [Rhodococcus sp. (in: high G+C Gram-positive bacteria)]
MNHLLITNCSVGGRHSLDIRITGGVITEIGRGLTRHGEDVLDADGNQIIPGLCDHHIHLHALAARRSSVECGPPAVQNSGELAAALQVSPGSDGWVRGVGYFESVAGGLDRDALDHLHASRPVRIQHRSGAMWVLNTAGVVAAGLEQADHPGIERDAAGKPTGRVWRADSWLRARIPGNAPPPLRDVGTELSRLGVTAVTDATPDLAPESIESICAAMSSRELPQRVHLLGVPLGVSLPSTEPTVGPYKIVLADSGLPDLEQLAAVIESAHSIGRAIAAHSVSREALLILLSVLGEIGTIPGDRIEHGALIPIESISEINRLGLAVVTQPGFIADRGDDYLEHVAAIDHQDLYRCRSLLDASVPVAFSSDAPYGPLDPWAVIAASQARLTPAGTVLGDAETIDYNTALDAYLGRPGDPGGPPRRVEVGAAGDLVLISRSQPPSVLATIIGGRQVY